MIHHTKHYFRAAFLIIGGLLSFFLVRAFLLPSSFGEYGHYRGENVPEQMNKPVGFASLDTCGTCHQDVADEHQSGSHTKVQCQNCHDIITVHYDTEKGEMVGPMPIQKTSKLCLRCHFSLPSRPADFPQITPDEHLKGLSDTHNPEICFQCHSPHSPKIGAKKGGEG